MRKIKNIVGEIFGRWKVLEFSESKNTKRMYKCICECGIIRNVSKGNLLLGLSKSCGCLNKEMVSKRSKTHGKSKTSEYCIWTEMKNRCMNHLHKQYFNYGGRGILICEEWIYCFENFYRDMGNRPSLIHSLDRIDNNKGYNKINCRWATSKQQTRNTRANIKYIYEGKNLILSDWAELYNVSHEFLWGRIRNGWSIEKALTTPKIRGRQKLIVLSKLNNQ